MPFSWAMGAVVVGGGLFQADISLPLPVRPANAVGGRVFAQQIESLPLQAREERIFEEVKRGNVPAFLRILTPLDLTAQIDGVPHRARIFVAPDYLAIGSNEDYLYMPMTPFTAQRIADLLDCSLPTPSMSDAIWAAAKVKLDPSPIPPSPAMTTVPVFQEHTLLVQAQRMQTLAQWPLGTLVAGDKKDIVLCQALATAPGKVAIYGWHHPDGKPIQPLYSKHLASWADYSHGVRLIAQSMELDGSPRRVQDVLADSKLAAILSGEGPLKQPRYSFSEFPAEKPPGVKAPVGETVTYFTPFPGVRGLIDAPQKLDKRPTVVVFALPNGNTIEQTFGHKMKPGDDWHYDIQHIAAQTRFLRGQLPDECVVVVYLENDKLAWPAWLTAHAPDSAVKIVSSVLERFKDSSPEVVLDSHSGGGALTFAYIQAVDTIPDFVKRIGFLDSEYRYETSVHRGKLADWLRKPGHSLCAIAYDDASALLNGKPFVSAAGGTWGKTHRMLSDLQAEFQVKRSNAADPERYTGLDGRITFLLKQNPTHEIFHTVQVERNGFIETLLSGTALDERDYRYFGERAYGKFIGD